MQQGYIKLYRQVQNNELWLSEPFTRGQAWIDLIMLANHKRNMFFKRGIEVVVERGQVGYSVLALSQRWQWSRGKVNKFLKYLEREQQIIQQKTHVTTLISICNYEKYQQVEQQTGQQNDNRMTTEWQQNDNRMTLTSNDNNDKNVNNEKKVKVTATKSRSKNTEFIDSLISDFADSYKRANGIDYIPSSMGKERAAIGWILREYKNKNPDNDSEMTRSGLKHYFNLCVNINDNWLRQNMSLSILRSKFNEINNILKNGNRKGNRKGATPEEIAEVVAKHFATDYPTE